MIYPPFKNAILNFLYSAPFGVQLNEVLGPFLERIDAGEEHSSIKVGMAITMDSVGIRCRQEFSEVDIEGQLLLLERGLFLIKNVASDILTISFTGTDYLEDAYKDEKEVIASCRALAIMALENQDIKTIDSDLIRTDALIDCSWKKAVSWLTNYNGFDDPVLTSKLVGALKLNANVHEGDFMLRPRVQGIKSSNLRVLIPKASYLIAESLFEVCQLAQTVLNGLTRTVLKSDFDSSQSVLNSDGSLRKIYYALCQALDAVGLESGGSQYLYQVKQQNKWVAVESIQRPKWRVVASPSKPDDFFLNQALKNTDPVDLVFDGLPSAKHPRRVLRITKPASS